MLYCLMTCVGGGGFVLNDHEYGEQGMGGLH